MKRIEFLGKSFFQHKFFLKQKEKNDSYQLQINNTLDSLEKSLLETNKYLENNLVQGKISLVQGKLDTQNAMQQQERQELQKISANELKTQADQLHTYFTFERNIAIFFSDMLIQFFSLISSSSLKLPREKLYKLMFLFSKFSIIYLQKVNSLLNIDENVKVISNQLIFKYYKTLPLFAQTQQLINIDLLKLNQLFKKLLPKLQELLKTNEDKNFEKICNDNFEQSEHFRSIFLSSINQILEEFFKQLDSYKENKQILILIRYLQISRSPYEYFNFKKTDFHKFYESFPKQNNEEIYGEIKKNQ
eukprot:TRINITY_DN6430_c0_g1_i2.p1 TRINITY_DN6430_c0_g1~~TRINITY_DN6430_c0_g1_i2.p1  ORF type:complete len:304 (-),score=32.57 TRINITY_DN6430_c0_g1_i2:288-1199(-)